MSEYQRYEFMTRDRPLTQEELEAVNAMPSHIQASSTHAIIEHHWGDFKHDPLAVLHKYFDGFLYWANWGAPKLAFRFPYGILPADLLHDYNLEEFVTFTRHSDYDILDLHKRVARSIWCGPTSSPCFILCLFRFAWRLAFCRARNRLLRFRT